ncbi:MAG TPA: sulfatase, partial [Verrucomicrobiae bacterium]|nr:sulfatase [Verrucomicrobiae bacterium]
LIEYYENNTVQLFNMAADPGEQHDLAKAQPEKARELQTLLHDWRKSVGAEMPTPNPNYDSSKSWPAGEMKDEP